MFLVHTAGVMNVGIDLADVVKVPRIQIIREPAYSAVEGVEIPVRDFLLKHS